MEKNPHSKTMVILASQEIAPCTQSKGLCSQQSVIGPYHKPHKTNPQFHTLLLFYENLFTYHHPHCKPRLYSSVSQSHIHTSLLRTQQVTKNKSRQRHMNIFY